MSEGTPYQGWHRPTRAQAAGAEVRVAGLWERVALRPKPLGYPRSARWSPPRTRRLARSMPHLRTELPAQTPHTPAPGPTNRCALPYARAHAENRDTTMRAKQRCTGNLWKNTQPSVLVSVIGSKGSVRWVSQECAECTATACRTRAQHGGRRGDHASCGRSSQHDTCRSDHSTPSTSYPPTGHSTCSL